MRAIATLILAAVVVAPLQALADADESTFLNRARQLTYDGKRAGEGYFSFDSLNLIFQDEREPENPFYQIYMLSFETGDVHRVSPGHGKTTCAFFHPSSGRVLYASTHLDPAAIQKQKDEIAFRESGKKRRYSWDYDETYDIFEADRDGGNITQLTTARGYDAEGSWSPDGSKIAFCSMRDGYPEDGLSKEDAERLELSPSYFAEIYMMDADGSNAKRLTDWPGYDGGPFFTPDGKRIVWRHFTEDGLHADIYTMKLDGSDRKRLTDFGSMCWAPYFHPSGRYAIFTTNKLGFSNFELYIVDADGRKEPVRVTFTDGFDGLPVFSPDGRNLCWTSNRSSDKNSQLFYAQWNHEAALEALEATPGRRSAEKADDDAHGALDTGQERVTVAGYMRVGDKKAGTSPDITADELRSTVAELASDAFGGRLTGSAGERKAGEFIARHFAAAGLMPLGDDGGFFQGFPFTSGAKAENDDCALEISASSETIQVDIEEGFRPLAFSGDGDVEGDVVFAGYGITMPGERAEGYDAYAGVDATDKIVLVLRYIPEEVDGDRRAQLNMYASLRYKAMVARENGARGLLIATGPNSTNAGKLVDLQLDQALASSGLPVSSVNGHVADMLFAGATRTLAQTQSSLDVENPHGGAFDLPGVRVRLKTTVTRTMGTGRNVLGYLPPGNDSPDAPVIVIGAHYDHLGHGGPESLAGKGEEGMVHNGADDNASGTALLLELAAALSAQRQAKPDRFRFGVVFAAWSGEEMGIIGSNYWMENPSVDGERVAAYINFDMVGRMRDNKLYVQGVGSSDIWKRMLEKRNIMAGFDLQISPDPYLPTDVTAFYPRDVPVLQILTGPHHDYHRPTDDANTLNYEDMERIGHFAKSLMLDLAGKDERPTYVKVERSREHSGSRSSGSVYVGTIPDYGGDIEGVKLTGVAAGGPADRAGIRGGDIIVAFAGREIKNIYDYSYALDAIKVGEPVTVVVMRDGKRVELEVVPEARDS